jgi:hypothetical protein
MPVFDAVKALPWARRTRAKIAARTEALGAGELLTDDLGGLYVGDGTTAVKDLVRVARRTEIVAKGELLVNVKDYGATGLGVVSERAAFVAAVDALAARGGTLLIPPGTYNDPYLRNAGKSFRVDCDNALFVQTAAAPVIYMQGTWGTTRTVSAVTTTTFNQAASGESVAAHALAVATASTFFKPGDRVFVFSDDTIPERRPTDGVIEDRLGQFAVVDNVTATQVVLTQRLRDTYTTNVRIAVLNDIPIKVTGQLTVDTVDAAFTNKWTNTLIQFDSLVGPSIDGFTIRRGSAMGVQFRSCFSYFADNYDIRNLTDDPANNQLGYAIADNASEMGNIGSGVAQNCRHGYTDIGPRVAAGAADPGSYGRSFRTTVDGMTVIGSSSDAISPHQCGESHIFRNIVAQGGRSAGFGIRGRNHQFIDCVSRNNPRDFRLISDTQGGETYGISIVNPTIEKDADTGAAAITISNHTGASDPLLGTRTNRLIATIDGGRCRGAAKWLTAINATVRVIGNPHVVLPATVPDGSAPVELINSVVTMEGTLDYRENTAGTSLRAVQIGDGTSTFRSELLRIRDTADVDARMTTIINGIGSPVCHVRSLVTDTYSSSTSPFGGAYSDLAYQWSRFDGKARSKYISRTHSNAASRYPLTQLMDDTIVIRIAASTDTDLSLGILDAGNHIGQVLDVYYQNTGFPNRTLTIENATSKGTQWVGANAVLTTRQMFSLVFDGSYWRPLTTTDGFLKSTDLVSALNTVGVARVVYIPKGGTVPANTPEYTMIIEMET